MSDNTYNNNYNTQNTNPYENLDDINAPFDNTTQQVENPAVENLGDITHDRHNDDALYQDTPSRPEPITPNGEDQAPVTERTEYVIRPEGDNEQVNTSQDNTTNNDESFTDKISEGFENFKNKVENTFDGDDDKEQSTDDDDLALKDVLDDPVAEDTNFDTAPSTAGNTTQPVENRNLSDNDVDLPDEDVLEVIPQDRQDDIDDDTLDDDSYINDPEFASSEFTDTDTVKDILKDISENVNKLVRLYDDSNF